jgi:hypothetical protein
VVVDIIRVPGEHAPAVVHVDAGPVPFGAGGGGKRCASFSNPG